MNNKMGPLDLLGTIFGFFGRSISVADTVLQGVELTAVESKGLINKGFKAINMEVDSSMADMEIKHLVSDANRQVRLAEANTEKAKILQALQG